MEVWHLPVEAALPGTRMRGFKDIGSPFRSPYCKVYCTLESLGHPNWGTPESLLAGGARTASEKLVEGVHGVLA